MNAIAPGFIQTDMTDKMPPEVIANTVARIPLKRLGQAQDIAETCLFLASKAGSYIHGTTLSVDGGLTT